MKCPVCGVDNQGAVIDSRNNYAYIRRRRECMKCGARYTTYEEISGKRVKRGKKEGKIKIPE